MGGGLTLDFGFTSMEECYFQRYAIQENYRDMQKYMQSYVNRICLFFT